MSSLLEDVKWETNYFTPLSPAFISDGRLLASFGPAASAPVAGIYLI
jgi:hypothetical protein